MKNDFVTTHLVKTLDSILVGLTFLGWGGIGRRLQWGVWFLSHCDFIVFRVLTYILRNVG